MNVYSSKYKCTECGNCFISNQKLTVHRQSHSGEKPFECTVCSKPFTDSASLVDTAEFTVERNHTNVVSVTNHLISLEI